MQQQASGRLFARSKQNAAHQVDLCGSLQFASKLDRISSLLFPMVAELCNPFGLTEYLRPELTRPPDLVDFNSWQSSKTAVAST